MKKEPQPAHEAAPKIHEAINAEHAAVQAAVGNALLHAHRCGELLQFAKKQVRHGGWLVWLKTNTTVSERTAHLYMRIANRWEQLTAGQNPQHVADLSLRGALVYLSDEEKLRAASEPRRPIPAPERRSTDDLYLLKQRAYFYLCGVAERVADDDLPALIQFLRDISDQLEKTGVDFLTEKRAEGGHEGGRGLDHAPYRAAYRAGVKAASAGAAS